MYDCHCTSTHARKRIVLTGGPGAGKTAVLELARQLLCRHVHILPEAAGILFGGRFPRGIERFELQAAQRAIYHVQRELEYMADNLPGLAVVVCDRGTVDGAAYWPGPGELWNAVGSSAAAELARYDAVIHMRTPTPVAYNHVNPLRIESAAEATAIDARIAEAWSPHPQRMFVQSTAYFMDKARTALASLVEQLPECCRPPTL